MCVEISIVVIVRVHLVSFNMSRSIFDGTLQLLVLKILKLAAGFGAGSPGILRRYGTTMTEYSLRWTHHGFAACSRA